MSVPPVQFTTAAEDEMRRRQRSPEDFVNSLDDDFLSCRGDRHSFPKLRPGPMPRGVNAVRQFDGSFQLTFTCPDCGTERTRTTLSGGGIERPVRYTYRYPQGYQSPKGSGLRKTDFSDELDRRVTPWIARGAK
jgi:hypothetical protein